ncbi:MAG: acyl carrier protein [bacterium]
MIPDKVKNLIAKEYGIDESTLTLETRLQEDLNVDSLDSVELVMRLEDEFGFKISDDEANGLRTVGDITTFVTQKLG